MSCRCPYCMSELDINKIKYYVKVENEPSQPKLKAFLAVNREDRHFYNFWSRYNRKLSPETLEKRIVKSLEEMENERARLAADAEQYERRMAAKNHSGENDEEIRPGQGIDNTLSDVPSDHFVVCEIIKEMKNRKPTQFTIREDGQRIAITYPVCPSCYNRIPEEIFFVFCLSCNVLSDRPDISFHLYRETKKNRILHCEDKPDQTTVL